jgi:hypothetical protein
MNVKQELINRGYKFQYITEEDFEDGVGPAIGNTYHKNGKWMGETEARWAEGLIDTSTPTGYYPFYANANSIEAGREAARQQFPSHTLYFSNERMNGLTTYHCVIRIPNTNPDALPEFGDAWDKWVNNRY